MTDTQWPAFQVFKQDREGAPHENVGTVHAPDAELALLNARDVFVRRPECVSLWVAPEAQITSRTAEEIADGLAPDGDAGREDEYRVFKKVHQRGSHVHAGSVLARSPIEALARAREAFSTPPALVWWVAPARFFTETAVEDRPSMFEGAREKPYRDQAFYHTDTLMRQVRYGKDAFRGVNEEGGE